MPGTARIYVFGEGKTDRLVFNFLKDKKSPESPLGNLIPVGGKGNFKHEILDKVKPDIEAKRNEIRVLVFRDVDEGEEVQNIVQSFQAIVEDLLEHQDLKPTPTSQGGIIYTWQVPANSKFPGFRFVLHIAEEIRGNPKSLRNRTTDGYVLALGLTEQVLEGFAEDVGSNNDILHKLITSKIPETIRQCNITINEDKDYLAAYLTATRFWVMKRSEEKELLTRIILERAWKYNEERFKEVFSSWFKAIEEVLR